MKRKLLPVWTLRWYHKHNEWRVYGREDGRRKFMAVGSTKRLAIWDVSRWLSWRRSRGEDIAVSLRIYRKDGRFAKNGEQTYPRSADPRRSKG